MVVRQPNTMVLPDDVDEHVLLIGGEHPGLVTEILNEFVHSCREVAHNRGFFTYGCRFRQLTAFTLGITGVGPSATEIAVVEYAKCGARTFIRAGTSGGLSNIARLGSVVITREALRYDGVSDL